MVTPETALAVWKRSANDVRDVAARPAPIPPGPKPSGFGVHEAERTTRVRIGSPMVNTYTASDQSFRPLWPRS
ncbi:hypothetical protein [Microbispora bryophytorum]|uniref:hypothetical protein n=1 Tax=Microbispora bryophytorum TaxID=1460882 RepID=UPI0033C8F867